MTQQPNPHAYISLDRETLPPQVGDRVFCTVTAIRSWMTITAVKGSGARLRIKTNCFPGWGYPHNFTRNPPAYMVRQEAL